VQAGGAKIDDSGFTINAISGPLIHDPALGSTLDGGLTKLGNGKLTLAANNTYTGPTYINAGILSLYAPPIGSISNSASIYIAVGAQLDLFAGGTSAMVLGSGKTIWGNGSVAGKFTVGAAAVLSPGSNSIGSLTFSNALTLAAGSTNIFEVSHLPLANDAVTVVGALTNGGTLVVSNSSGVLAAGDTFQLFTATSYSGSFSTVILPSLNAGLAWDTNQLNFAGTISVVSTAPANPPVFGTISSSGGSIVMSGSNGTTGGPYYVLASTNVALPMTNWPRVSTNNFDANGFFAVTNVIQPGKPQQFFRLEVP
jgi:autotransporter-associated beta strand protein